jgi:hypothetical protein
MAVFYQKTKFSKKIALAGGLHRSLQEGVAGEKGSGLHPLLFTLQ